MNKFFLGVLVLLLTAPSFADSKLLLENAWVREAPPMAKNLAGYVEIKNTGNKAVTIESMSSPLFAKVKMHDMTMHDGMMHMSHLESVTLRSGESLSFSPGGKHLMLMKPKQPIKVGLIVPVIFKLQSGQVISVDFKVQRGF